MRRIYLWKRKQWMAGMLYPFAIFHWALYSSSCSLGNRKPFDVFAHLIRTIRLVVIFLSRWSIEELQMCIYKSPQFIRSAEYRPSLMAVLKGESVILLFSLVINIAHFSLTCWYRTTFAIPYRKVGHLWLWASLNGKLDNVKRSPISLLLCVIW